jgi:hypothetical protein
VDDESRNAFRFRCFCNGPLVVKLRVHPIAGFVLLSVVGVETAASCCMREWRSNLPGVVSGSLPATATEPASPSPRSGEETSWEPRRLGPAPNCVPPLRYVAAVAAGSLPQTVDRHGKLALTQSRCSSAVSTRRAQEVQTGSAVRLALDQLELGDLAFSLAV